VELVLVSKKRFYSLVKRSFLLKKLFGKVRIPVQINPLLFHYFIDHDLGRSIVDRYTDDKYICGFHVEY